MKLRIVWAIALLALCCVSYIILTGRRDRSAPTILSAKELTAAEKAPAPPKRDAVATSLRGEPIYVHAKRAVAISPDGLQVAVGDGEGQIEFWSIPEKRRQHLIKAHSNWTFDLAYSPDGTLVSGGGDDLIKLFDPASGKMVRGFAQHDNDLHGVAVTADGQWLISGGDDAVVFAKSLTDTTLSKLGRHEAQVTAVAVSPDGRLAATASRDRTVCLWDLERMSQGPILRGHDADVMSVAFSPSGDQLVSCGYDKTVIIWNVDAVPPRLKTKLNEFPDWMFAVAFSRSGRHIFAGGGKGSLFSYDLETRKLTRHRTEGDVSDLALARDGRLLAVVTSKGSLQLFSVDPETAALTEEKIFSKPIPNPSAPPPPPLSTTEYLERHEKILDPAPTWGDELAKLAPFADPFTAELLGRIRDEDLQHDQRELKQRVLDQLATRRGDDVDSFKLSEIGSMLIRSAAAEESSPRLNAILAPWLERTLRGQLSDKGVRDRLRELRVALESENSPQNVKLRARIDAILKQMP